MTSAPACYDTRLNAERAKRNHIRQLEALGYKVTLQPAAYPGTTDPAWTRLRCAPPGAAAYPLTVDFRISRLPVRVRPGAPASIVAGQRG